MITRVIAKNFLSWKDMDVVIPKGATNIDGWNEDDQTPEGSGKSAILNAISWCLYGCVPKDANIDEVIKEGEKTCCVQVFFSDGTSILRSRKPNELFMAAPDGRTIKGKDARETQVLIEQYIGISFETFCQTQYFAQNYPKKFILSNQEDKGKILSEAQDLTVFDRAGKEVRTLAKIEEDSLTKMRHSKDLALKDEELTKRDITAEELRFDHARQQQAQRINSLNLQIAAEDGRRQGELQQQVERIKNLNLRIDAEGVRKQTELQQQAQAVEGVKRQIADAQKMAAEQEDLKKQFVEGTQALVYDEVKEKALQESNNQLMSQAGGIKAEIAGIDKLIVQRNVTETQGNRYAAMYKSLQADKNRQLAFIANPTKNCPTCGTVLEKCDTGHAQTEVARLDGELSQIMTTLTSLDAELNAPVPSKDDLNAKLGTIRQQQNANDLEIQTLRAIKEKLQRAAIHVASFDRNIKSENERVARLQRDLERESQPRTFDETQLNSLKAQLEIESRPLTFDETQLNSLKAQLQAESRPLQFDTAPLEALKTKLVSVQNSVQELERLIAEKTSHLKRLEDLKGGFKEVKSHVFGKMLSAINARTQKHLTQLFEVPISVRFTNEDMKIGTQVKFDGVERSLGLLSGGQFRRVSLAVDLALSEVVAARKGSKIGLLILDEYFKDLSEPSMEKCLTLLEGQKQPVLLIEHNSIFKNIVNNSIFVRLENGTTRIDEAP